jgi:hypothetical protein
MLVELVIAVAVAAGLWKSFEKMGRKGWEGIVPIYNMYVLMQVMGKDIKWFIFCLIPFLCIIPMIDVAKAFGKDTLFGVGLAFAVCWPVLGFTDASWQGSGAPATA